MNAVLFDDHRYTVCGVKFGYFGTLSAPSQGSAEVEHSFRQSLTLPRTAAGNDQIAQLIEDGVLIVPTGINRTERDFGGNARERVDHGTAWLIFGFTDSISTVGMQTFGRRLEILLTERQYSGELQSA